jgi:hypothetical protein
VQDFLLERFGEIFQGFEEVGSHWSGSRIDFE